MNTQDRLRQAALEYHEFPQPGKLAVTPTKQMVNQSDLSLAYSPGVAAASEEIAADPVTVARYTARGNLVAVITNGTAVLGLGDIGPLAAKPVMEGKAVLFKKFAGIDVFDIEIAEKDPDRLIDIIAALEPTFGGINLEDIKAPECFYIEQQLRERMRIPVFHDDQHGTAIIVGAAVANGLQVVGKRFDEIKLVVSGAGAAALACVDLLVELGVTPDKVWLTDRDGVVHSGRNDLDTAKARYAKPTEARTLGDLLHGADVFLGLSAGGVLKPDMLAAMAAQPLILALANPTPEILPELARAARPDAIIATGRSDYPNQVNNVLCFPFMFRGALDVGATGITAGMEIAAVHSIADLARQEASDVVSSAYASEDLAFGPDYLIPKPFDPRLIVKVAPAVAQAAMDDGVATRPIEDFDAYRSRLQDFVFHSGMIMKPIITHARQVDAQRKRVVFAEGEDERVLRAVQALIDEKIARPLLIGRPAVIESRIARYGLRLQAQRDYELVNPEDDPRYRDYWAHFRALAGRRGVTEQDARLAMRQQPTLIAAMLLAHGEAQAMICGTVGRTAEHLNYIDLVLGRRAGGSTYGAMNALILPGRQVFIVDTHINPEPSADELAEITRLAAAEIRRFGIEPRVALLSHSNFGTAQTASARKMREVLAKVREHKPDFEIDGEMHGDCALDEAVRRAILPESTLTGVANLLVCPNIDAANIVYNVLKTAAGNGVAVGPILLGCAAPAHILTPSATVRRIINMSAIAVVQANAGNG